MLKLIVKRHKGILAIATILNSIGGITSVFLAILLQILVDTASAGDTTGFARIVGIFIGYMVICTIIDYSTSKLVAIFSKKMGSYLRCQIMDSFLSYPISKYDDNDTGEYISTINNDVSIVIDNYIIPFINIISFITSVVVTTLLLTYYSYKVTIFVVLFSFVFYLLPSKLIKGLQLKQEAFSVSLARFTSVIKDILSGFTVIKSYKVSDNFYKYFDDENALMTESKYSIDKLLILNNCMSQLSASFLQLSTIILSAYFFLTGEFTLGIMMAVIQLSGTYNVPLRMIYATLPQMKSATPIIEKLNKIQNKENIQNVMPKDSFTNSIDVVDLSFSYNGNANVLSNINYTFEKGKKYVIIGKNGSGKSTLAKLIAGYYPCYKGKIMYDGVEINKTDVSPILSYVQQDVRMFQLSIKDNICLFDTFTNDNLKYAIRTSGMEEFLHQMPNDLETIIEEEGMNLSGGQKQRIAIARALIRNMPILIFDEGTSAIDGETSNTIESDLHNISNITLISITHKLRPSVLRGYDEVIYIDDGKIVEKGGFDYLMQNRGMFYEYYASVNQATQNDVINV